MKRLSFQTKAILISIGCNAVFILVMIGIIYRVIMGQFQTIENQRVERNIKRVSAIIADRLEQMNAKLADWTIWDDTYSFLENENTAYIQSNLSQDSFANLQVDEALFINKEGRLVTSLIVDSIQTGERNFPEDLYIHFATGSALLAIPKDVGYKGGILATDDGLLLFAIREVVKSDGSGIPNGYMVFAKYFDSSVITHLKELTQFDALLYLWNDPQMPEDIKRARNVLTGSTRDLTQVLNDQIIAGYQVVFDIFGAPQAIIRTNIQRDIILQGHKSMTLLLWLVIGIGALTSIVNNYLFMIITRRISTLSHDVNALGQLGDTRVRLTPDGENDEIDHLRIRINELLDSLGKERQKGDSIIDLVNAIIVVLDQEARIVLINKKGRETLGYTQEELIGKNWITTCIPLEEQAHVHDVFSSLIHGQARDIREMENCVHTKKGKVMLIHWHNTILKNSAGIPISTISVGEDVTEQKVEEEKKKLYQKDMERMNALMIDREIKMKELKEEIRVLQKKGEQL